MPHRAAGVLLLWICLGLALPDGPAAAASAQSIAVAVKSSGEVALKPASGDPERQLARGDRLNDGDLIRTGAEGRAVLVFTDDRSQLKLTPLTELVLHAERSAGRTDKEVEMSLGTLWSKVTRQQGEFRIATPTSVASVKGTAWWTKLDEQGTTTIVTEEGIVGLVNRRSGDAVDVPMGHTGESSQEEVIVRVTNPDDREGLERGELKTVRIPVMDGDERRTLIIEYYD